MPSYPPRSDTTKKQEQLLKREHELRHAIHSKLSRDRLVRAVENLRQAHLSLLEAKLYWVIDEGLGGNIDEGRILKIEMETDDWTARTSEQILRDYETC